MKLPTNQSFVEDDCAFYWMEDELLCSIAKSTPRTAESVKRTFGLVQRLTGDKRVCLLADINAAGYRTEDARTTSIELCTQNFIAMALIAESSYGKLVGNTFITISGSPVPMKLCTTESEARDWLKQFQPEAVSRIS